MMDHLRIVRLDREAAHAALAHRAALREIRRRGPRAVADDAPGGGIENPLDPARAVSSRATYLELTGRGARIGAELGLAGAPDVLPQDPLAAPLAAWVHALTLERVLWSDRVRLAAAWHATSIVIEGEEALFASPRDALLRLLAEPADDARGAWATAIARGSGAVADAARILVERRSEAIRRLGPLPAGAGEAAAEDARAAEIPSDPPGALLDAAAALLARTEAAPARGATWDGVLARAVGRDAASGWPARLTSRWIEALFRGTPLSEGLVLDLGPLPRPLGASSFARALARFGAALADATPPDAWGRGGAGARPFSLSHAPFDLRRARRGALFGGLVADPVFCARALGLGRGRARDQARAAARALLVTLRLDAARARLVHGDSGHVLLLGARRRADLFQEETGRALGVPIPGELAGVIPALEPSASVRLAGALLAARDRRALIEGFDEDWYRNPRAAEAIRHEDEADPTPRATAAALDAGVDALIRTLGEL